MRSTKYLPLVFLIFVIISFFYPFTIFGKFPIPADTIIGLYHPYRDFYATEYPNGIPYKNSLTTDPVRQQFPWRYLSILEMQRGSLPTWNPYNLSGSPLLGNFQSAAFYPLNLLLFLPDFTKWWSILIMIQPLLAGVFMYLYLKEEKLNTYSVFLGAFVYAFCGFSVAWLEWGTIGHVALWLPLILLSIDKIFIIFNKYGHSSTRVKKSKIRNFFKNFTWPSILVFSLSSSFFAGHLQVFFYLFIISLVYLFIRWIQSGVKLKPLLLFLFLFFCFLLIIVSQLIPTLQLIFLSARDIDQIAVNKEGWYLPVQHLIQFIAPDFFGNPTTLNYWGVWNYGEFIGYVGIFPLIMAFFAMFHRYDKKTIFFGSVFFLSLIFALPTWFASIPFEFKIPFLNSSQPTRLLFLTDFSLSVLAALGLDYFVKSNNRRKIIYPIIELFFVFVFFWLFIFGSKYFLDTISQQNISVAKSNLYLPTITFLISSALIILYLTKKINKFNKFIIVILLFISIFDLFRFSYKFLPFTEREYLFPDTQAIYYVMKFGDHSRFMTTDDRIFPPNFSIMYFVQDIGGYDPLYLKRYGELIAAIERDKPDISYPLGFNRILQPHNFKSRLIDMMGVKYILSLSELKSPKLKLVREEGETRVYENTQAFKRAFFVKEIIPSKNKQFTINNLFDEKNDLKEKAVVEGFDLKKTEFKLAKDEVDIISYKPNEILIKTENDRDGFLVLSDSYYPTWKASVCSQDISICKQTKIYLTNYNFRGIVVPQGTHFIKFQNTFIQ